MQVSELNQVIKAIKRLDDTKCPCCGSEQVEGRFVETGDNEATQAMDCMDCNSEWVNGYVLHTQLITQDRAPKPSHWDEHEGWPVEDWQLEVANGDTRLGYHEWVANEREQAS